MYVSSLPPAALPHLELQLDWDHEGVEKDLCEIAHHMLDWEQQLSTRLGLTPVDISDTKDMYSNKPELQRYCILVMETSEVFLDDFCVASL